MSDWASAAGCDSHTEGAAGGVSGVEGTGEYRAQDTSAVERIGGQEIQAGQIEIGPYQAARQIADLKEGRRPEADSGGNRTHNSRGKSC